MDLPAVPPTTGRRRRQRIELHPGYGLLTLAYMGVIWWLSSLPELGVGSGNPLVRLASNLLHIPLYAGLTFCFLKTVRGERGGCGGLWELSSLTFLGTGAFAALDEWHQAFVPGRQASLGDFFLDLAGILGLVLVLRLQALRRKGS